MKSTFNRGRLPYRTLSGAPSPRFRWPVSWLDDQRRPAFASPAWSISPHARPISQAAVTTKGTAKGSNTISEHPARFFLLPVL